MKAKDFVAAAAAAGGATEIVPLPLLDTKVTVRAITRAEHRACVNAATVDGKDDGILLEVLMFVVACVDPAFDVDLDSIDNPEADETIATLMQAPSGALQPAIEKITELSGWRFRGVRGHRTGDDD